jgi:radical SAM superfamily enzyme YgiQ (UPF0313 family)
MIFNSDQKILLLLLPFWDPLIPPQGIASIKNYLQHHGYTVSTRDANLENKFKMQYDRYFDTLRTYIPKHRQGNFFNIGHDVLRSHMMAHIQKKDETEYIQLIQTIIYKTFFSPITSDQVQQLTQHLETFYATLDEYIVTQIKREKPDVLGISVMRDTMPASLYAFRRAKQVTPGIMTLMGGSTFANELAQGSQDLDYFLEKTPYIDHIIIGEGYSLFLKLLKGELPPQQKVFTSADIGGHTIGFSELRNPDLSDFNVQQDYPYLAGQSSSSCPYQCSFCNVAAYYGAFKKKDPRQTQKEMKENFQKYGNQLFFMTDALLNTTATELSREFIKSDIKLYWDGYLRVDHTTTQYENALLWRQGGFYRARIGVETGSQKVLNLMDKKITVAQTRKTLSSLAGAGIKTTAYIVIGHPGETEEDFQMTLDLIRDHKNDIWEVECNPFIFSYTGQAHSNDWEEKRILLYPPQSRELLMIQSWDLEVPPGREEAYNRVCRFVEHCDKLGVPNPYTLREIYQADERWKRLHKNAVPSLVEFKEGNRYIDECKDIKEIRLIRQSFQEEGDFEF